MFVLDLHLWPPCGPHRAALKDTQLLVREPEGAWGVAATGNRAPVPSLPSSSLSLLFLPHLSSAAFPKGIAGLLGPIHVYPPIQPPSSAPPCPPPPRASCPLPVWSVGKAPLPVACMLPSLHHRVLDTGHTAGSYSLGLVRLPSLAFRLPPPASAAPRWGAFSHQVLFSSFLPVFAPSAMNLI